MSERQESGETMLVCDGCGREGFGPADMKTQTMGGVRLDFCPPCAARRGIT